ncbi:ABC transporter permease [Streptomyces yaanensis]|uniref:ABC transporter permease n=1 Tax=Streptomyces yaanensis TaxID=1142239 RepID=A0ABV7SLP7_9ACTN|nr:ABC transporter permease [Streptomyces sp. CGMCC 4.7035]WNC01906.1 ABC transporter permease [Streptomyces sp. CGMCC 4.7035]
MSLDLRLAWLLTRGSDRREWWRALLTAVGAGLATGFGLAAVAVAALRGHHSIMLASGLLNEPGERAGVVLTLLMLLVPVLGFLGQCARIGAVHRDRRLAALRLAGAAPGQVRRIAALEAGLACLAGSAVVTVFSVLFMLQVWQGASALMWAGFAVVAVAAPVLGVLVSVLALRHVVTEPLGRVQRVRQRPGKGLLPAFLVAALVVLIAGVFLWSASFRHFPSAPVLAFAVVALTGMGAVGLSGATARRTGRLLADRTGSPAVLIAAERLRDDPWTAARTHAAVLLVTVVGTGFVGVRQVLLDDLHRTGPDHLAMNMSFYTTGVNLTGVAVLVALAITLSGLAVGTAEALATRRRGLAAQVAAGVPASVLVRALLLETALPLAPAVVLAGAGGMAIGAGYARLTEGGAVPLAPLLVPVAVYAACVLAAATSLPLLRRSVRPAELRYA